MRAAVTQTRIIPHAAAARLLDRLARAGRQHHHGAAGRAAPALLRRGDQHVHTGLDHVHPHRAGGHAVQHHQGAHLVRRIADGADVVVGQQDAAGGFHVRGKHHLGLFSADGRGHVLRSTWRPRILATGPLLARLADHGTTAQAEVADLENLRPAVAEPAVAHDQHLLPVGKLARHGLHAEGAAARHQHGRVGVVDLLERAQDVLHHAGKALGHVVQGAVGVDHREFQQAVWIDFRQKSGHVFSELWLGAHAGQTATDSRGTPCTRTADPA